MIHQPASPHGSDAQSTDLEALNREKLWAEIDDTYLRIENEKSGLRRRRFKAALKYLSIIVPLTVGLSGVLIQWSEHVAQSERLARFDVGPEIIKLASQLESDSESTRALAAYQLAWFGRPVAFMLFERLVTVLSPNVRGAIVMALVEVARSDPRQPSVLSRLIASTYDFLGFALRSKGSMETKLKARLNALADVAPALRATEELDRTYTSAVQRLQSTRKQIMAQPSDRLSDSVKQELYALIDSISG